MARILSLLLALLIAPTALAQDTIVNFDEPAAPVAPCTFYEAEPLTTQYEEVGVVFQGGMEILNECGNFGIVEHSGNRFLGWNVTSNGNGPPETLIFSTPVSYVSFLTGSQVTGEVTATAYDGQGREIATRSLTLMTSAMRLELEAQGIVKVVIASTAQYGAIDDIRFRTMRTAATP